jgi:hypothetical protein
VCSDAVPVLRSPIGPILQDCSQLTAIIARIRIFDYLRAIFVLIGVPDEEIRIMALAPGVHCRTRHALAWFFNVWRHLLKLFPERPHEGRDAEKFIILIYTIGT